MPDVFDKAKRSEVMSRIRHEGNKGTELAMIRLFRLHGIKGWRRRSGIYGKPDFIFPKARIALFVDGCFWHGCPEHGRNPGSNQDYWTQKLRRNRSRDLSVNRELAARGWRVIRVWEHELRRPEEVLDLIERSVSFVPLALSKRIQSNMAE